MKNCCQVLLSMSTCAPYTAAGVTGGSALAAHFLDIRSSADLQAWACTRSPFSST
jgi:hypothetical protein